MKLRDYLQARGTRQLDFAKSIGVDPSSVCRYLSGEREPRADIARKIVKVTKGMVTLEDSYG